MCTGFYSHSKGLFGRKHLELIGKFPGTGLKLSGAQLYTKTLAKTHAFCVTHEFVRNYGMPVFLDSKVFATPSEMYDTSFAITEEKVRGFTIAAQTGFASMEAAVAGRNAAYEAINPHDRLRTPKPLIFGACDISWQKEPPSENEQSIWHKNNRDMIMLLQKSGVDGVMCYSAITLKLVNKIWPEAKTLVTNTRTDWAPWAAQNDNHQYTINLAEAAELRADYIAAGSIVNKAPNPLEAFSRFLSEIGHKEVA